MNQSGISAPAADRPAQGAARQPAYSQDARSYDQNTDAFQGYRRAVVEALPVRRGQVVLDVGCGTGLCCGLLVEKVGPRGAVVGIEESPEMAAVARERIARAGWPNATVVQAPAGEAQIPVIADAALFCAVHDILQSPGALRNVMNHLRPGAQVAAGGGKWAAPWLLAVNLLARMLHAPYVRSFEGFDRPWHHLEQLIEDVHVRELAFGSGYILTGRSSRSRRPGSRAVSRARPDRGPAGLGIPDLRSPDSDQGRGHNVALPKRETPACLEQRPGPHLRRGDAHSVIGVDLVHRCARDRPGQLQLTARRHERGPGW